VPRRDQGCSADIKVIWPATRPRSFGRHSARPASAGFAGFRRKGSVVVGRHTVSVERHRTRSDSWHQCSPTLTDFRRTRHLQVCPSRTNSGIGQSDAALNGRPLGRLRRRVESLVLTMKGRFHIEPVAKTGICQKRSPASSINGLRTKDLASITAFSEGPNSLVTGQAGGTIAAEPAERLPGGQSEVGQLDAGTPLVDLPILIPVQLAGGVVIRAGQSFEKPAGRIEPGGASVTLPPVVSGIIGLFRRTRLWSRGPTGRRLTW
jgi:hypothetical protein